MSSAKKFRVGLYARASTTKASQDQSVDGQLDDLRSYFARREDCEIVMVESDRVSGSKGERDRPGLGRILTAARGGKLDIIGIRRLDRLFRSLPHWISTQQELSGIGVSILMTDHPELDPTSGPMARFLVAFMAALAELQRDLYGNAAKEGKARALAQGKHCARPRETVPVEAFRLVHSWVLAGASLSWRQMSQRLQRSGHVQPERVIKSTGQVRKARCWNPGQLWRDYRDYRQTSEALAAVQNTPLIAASRTGAKAGNRTP